MFVAFPGELQNYKSFNGLFWLLFPPNVSLDSMNEEKEPDRARKLQLQMCGNGKKHLFIIHISSTSYGILH